MAYTTFLNNVNKEKVKELMSKTADNVAELDNVLENVVASYSAELDEVMSTYPYKQLGNLETDELEAYCLELSNLLYFMGAKLEQLGIHNDMSKAAKQEVFNKAYLANQTIEGSKKPTVAENTAIAEQTAQYETVVNNLYDRAYKILKFKIDAAFEMVGTLRKIISRRMQEFDFSKYQPKNNV